MFIEKIKHLFKVDHLSKPSRFSGKRILTIDDEATQRTMIERVLSKKGFLVSTADNGLLGLDMANRQRPDLILLDVLMPGMTGEKVCQKLKSNKITRDIPVIFLTSQDAPKEVIQHYELGADIHLTKPVNASELIQQVEITLEEYS